APYDVSRTDFFRELNRFVTDTGAELAGVGAEDVIADPDVLRRFDSFVITDRFLPEPADGGSWSAEEARAFADAVRAFASDGGNVVLTDGAVAGLAALDVGIEADAVTRGVYYAGYVDFNDGSEPTFDRHPLTENLAQEGTASGRQTLDGEQYYDRRQTYEPVPMGFLVGGPRNCRSGCDAPIWVVDEAAWTGAGGLHLGRSYVRPGPQGGKGWDGVSLGELPLGDGVVRIVGALLPEPTQDNFHPYGLSSFGLTYTGYQLFENATTWRNPGRDTGGDEPTEGRPGAVPPDDRGKGKGQGQGKPGDHAAGAGLTASAGPTATGGLSLVTSATDRVGGIPASAVVLALLGLLAVGVRVRRRGPSTDA
ncbi:MAG: hypothetical protein KY457_05490, partial [Actinobacteria bacterium]|nr:hypothetical protein [Actinomycetota bacterium]